MYYSHFFFLLLKKKRKKKILGKLAATAVTGRVVDLEAARNSAGLLLYRPFSVSVCVSMHLPKTIAIIIQLDSNIIEPNNQISVISIYIKMNFVVGRQSSFSSWRLTIFFSSNSLLIFRGPFENNSH